MSSRLNPRDYDLGELRDAVRESPRRRDDGREDRQAAGQPADPSVDGTSPLEAPDREDSMLEEAGDGPRAERTAETRPDGRSSGVRRSEDGHDGRDGGAESVPGRDDDRPSVGRPRRNRARFARSPSRDRTPDGEPRRRGRSGERERSRRGSADRNGRSGRAASTSVAPGTHAGGFELLATGSRGDVERPYLDRLPEAYRAQLEIFEWLEGLLGTCGREATAAALAYYESVGWLSGESRVALEEFLEGLSAAEPPDPRPLDVDDHRESLRYVARLAHRVDR